MSSKREKRKAWVQQQLDSGPVPKLLVLSFIATARRMRYIIVGLALIGYFTGIIWLYLPIAFLVWGACYRLMEKFRTAKWRRERDDQELAVAINEAYLELNDEDRELIDQRVSAALKEVDPDAYHRLETKGADKFSVSEETSLKVLEKLIGQDGDGNE